MERYKIVVLRIVQDIVRQRKKENRAPLCATTLEISAAAYKEYGLAPEVVSNVLERLTEDGALTVRPVMNGKSYYVNQ